MPRSAPAAATTRPASPATHLERLHSTLPAPLRRKLRRARELAAPEATERFSTAIAAIDQLLPGGLPRGRLVEVIGRRSSGRFSILLSALATLTGAGDCAALVDLGDSLDTRAASLAGVDLERLLWLRPQHMRTALAAAEVLLHCGFPLIVLDLGTPPVPGGRGAEPSWLRLARGAAARGSAVLVSSPYRASGTAATAVLEASGALPLWHRLAGRSARDGSGSSLLAGLSCPVRLAKLRGTHANGKTSEFRMLTPPAAATRLIEPAIGSGMPDAEPSPRPRAAVRAAG